MDARTATLNDGSDDGSLVDDDGEQLGFAIGQIIDDKYRLDKLLGSGGMGVVFGATHLALDERVAIKLLRPGLARDQNAVARFLREARASVKLKGANVARITDVDELNDSGDPYIVMEWLDGENLASTLDREGPLPLHDVLRWLKETCAAIEEAHALGIIHRDLKPANLFLARAKNGDVSVKVLDFGVSRILDDSNVARGLDTSANLVVGTPHYMAPEQHEGARKADVRSDVWALGVIAYELLTGALPFRGDTPAVVYATILTTATPSPRRLRSDLPARMDALIMRAIDRDPSARFQTVRELSAALDAITLSLATSVPVPVPAPTTSPNLMVSEAPSISRGVGEAAASPSTSVGVTSVSSPSRRNAFIGALAIGFLGTLIVTWVAMHRARTPDDAVTTTTSPSASVTTLTTAPPPPALSTAATPSPLPSATTTAPSSSSPSPSSAVRPRPHPIKSAAPSSSASPVDESYKHRTF